MPQRRVREETERPAQEEGGGLLGGVLDGISGSGFSNGRSSGPMTTTQAVIGSVTPAIAATAGRKFIQSIFHSHPGRALWRMGSPCDTPKLIYQYIYSMSQGLFCRMIISGFSCCNYLLIEEVFAPWMFYDCFGE